MYKEVFINFNGKRASILIDCLDDGEKDRIPCFVVGLSSHYHDKFSEKFRSQYQLILMDLYWTDDSYESNYIETLSLKDMADHIEIVRQEMEDLFGDKFHKIILLGHSVYGFLTLEYAFHHSLHIHGVVNVCTPLLFKESVLQALQTEYIDSNFGSRVQYGTHQRWADYYKYKSDHKVLADKSPVISSKEKFVRWYLSMGPILWKERSFWRNEGGRARALWNPWRIDLVSSGEVKNSDVRDVNMLTLNHYIKLAKKVNYEKSLHEVNVPLLWFIGLFDARVSLYSFELYKNDGLMEEGVEIYYTNTGHWPMFEKGHSEFDVKACEWLGEICEQDLVHEESRHLSRV